MKLKDTCILIVDDEELVREVSVMLVEDQGAKVIQATCGAQAIDKFKEHHGEIDAILMDFSLPKYNGLEAYLEMQKVKVGVPVILVSGLLSSPEVQELERMGLLKFLNKPYESREMIDLLTDMIRI